MDLRISLLITQIYIHIIFFAGLVLLPLSFSLPTIIVCQIIFVGLCGTVFYHRVVTHKHAIKPIIEKVLIFLSWIGASGSAIGWAGTHRMHHKYSDTIQDPHSPKHIGKLKTNWWSSGTERAIRFVPDLLRKQLYLFQHQHYFKVLFLFHAIILLTCSLPIYWMLCITPAFCMWFAGSMTNIFGHNDNGPVNNSLMGYAFAGEGWHKNHHDFGSASKFNKNGDWGYMIYKLIKKD